MYYENMDKFCLIALSDRWSDTERQKYGMFSRKAALEWFVNTTGANLGYSQWKWALYLALRLRLVGIEVLVGNFNGQNKRWLEERAKSVSNVDMMKTPIFAYEPNDLSAFSTKEAAEAYIEAIDVLDDVYPYVFDADGYLLDAVVVENRWIKIRPTKPLKRDRQTLFDILHRHVSHVLTVKGQSDEWLETATLADLVAWVAENDLM